MQFATVQFDIIWEDKSANHALIEQLLHEAGIESGTFVLLPELGDTGFSFNLPKILDEKTLDWGIDLARRLGIWLQVGYARSTDSDKGLNCASIISPQGEVIATYAKIHPFSYSRESEYFVGGDQLVIRTCDGLKVCPMICYDLRFPELWRHGVLGGAEVFTIGASWPEARQAHWRSLLLARAIENQAFVVAVNRIGVDPNLGYAGGSLIISPRGEILAEAGHEPQVLRAELNPNSIRRWREEFPALRDLRRDLLGAIPIDQTI